jgi:hypothetical protein
VIDIDEVVFLQKELCQLIQHDNGAMLAVGAAETEVQVGFPLFLVERNEKLGKLEQFTQKCSAFFPPRT